MNKASEQDDGAGTSAPRLVARRCKRRLSIIFERRENVIALGPSGTGKTRIALGLAAAFSVIEGNHLSGNNGQKGLPVAIITAAALANELLEARDENHLLRRQRQRPKVKRLIVDELGFVPLIKTGAEPLFELISKRYEQGSTLINRNLPFEEWTEPFGTERQLAHFWIGWPTRSTPWK